MEKQYALRIYKTQNELLTVVTTRTGLIVNEAAGEVAYPVTTFEKQKNGKVNEVQSNGLLPFIGKEFILFDITSQKEITSGVVTETITLAKPVPAEVQDAARK